MTCVAHQEKCTYIPEIETPPEPWNGLLIGTDPNSNMFHAHSDIQFMLQKDIVWRSRNSSQPCGKWFAGQFIVNVSLGTDLWMMCVSSQICMHFGYLAKKLAAYLPSRERERADCEFLCSFVQKHQQILRLHKEVNQVFGLLLASNLFTTASLLCCMAFYTVVQGLNAEGISYMMLFASVAAQFYMVSSYGQRLIDLSFSISMAAYLQNWYDGSIRYKKDLLLIMARAQRPAEISAKGIIVISLDTFKILMSITYRFFAVIRQTVGK
ncbi:odorant receptor 49a-like [Drosophila pseudoobscura]|uniref:Odorant receptor 49a-like n=1 Tax=Drosophila pseudoobscura pseudoobscura TaxID=46245 RepID=A0A6I8V400_DROPS|nr:odorant receptor 49a [Drosophila pseudoobscura]